MSILHAWSKFTPKDPEALRRHTVAQETWGYQHWIDRGVEDHELPRLFQEGKRRFPYVRDILDHASKDRPDEDILVLTNADIGTTTDFSWRVAMAMQSTNAGYANRRDAHHAVRTVPTDEEVRRWHSYVGTDTFFFRVGWWRKHRTIMPDMIIAREAWDAILRTMIELTASGGFIHVPDITWHERHGGDGYWEDPKNRYTIAGQVHNLGLAKRFCKQHMINPAKFGIR